MKMHGRVNGGGCRVEGCKEFYDVLPLIVAHLLVPNPVSLVLQTLRVLNCRNNLARALLLMTDVILSILLFQSSLTYRTDIKPIFQQRCFQCHSSGYWNWMQYENAFKYKDQIKWRVSTIRSMPPGGNITEEERNKIRDWVDQGAKE